MASEKGISDCVLRLETRKEEIEAFFSKNPRPLREKGYERGAGFNHQTVNDVYYKSMGKELEAIRVSLKRGGEGKLGVCTGCGRDISDKRLEAAHSTTLCFCTDCNSGKRLPLKVH